MSEHMKEVQTDTLIAGENVQPVGTETEVEAVADTNSEEKVKNTVEEILQNITKPKDLTWTHEVVFRNFLSIGPTKDKSLGISIAKEALNNIEKVRESS